MKSRDAGARQAWRRGRRGEAVAALWLRLKGYRILARGLTSPVGEIDIVARRGATLAIVEVKRRADYDVRHARGDATPAGAHRAGGRLAGRPAARSRQATIRFDIVLIAPRRWPRHLADAWRVPPGR